MSLESAGLVIGIATVVGGCGGLFLGASLSDYYKRKGVTNAYFIVPAFFCVPSAALVWLALNINSGIGSSVLFMLSEVFVWTYNSPISKYYYRQTKEGDGLVADALVYHYHPRF